MIRLVYVLRRKPELSREQFQEYWRDVHGLLVASFAKHLEILRYVQVHTVGGGGQLGAARGQMEEPYDGVAELWWESEEVLRAASATDAGRAAGAALLEDEARFIDQPNSPLWLAHDYPQINPRAEHDVVARPRSSVIKLHYPLRHLPRWPWRRRSVTGAPSTGR